MPGLLRLAPRARGLSKRKRKKSSSSPQKNSIASKIATAKQTQTSGSHDDRVLPRVGIEPDGLGLRGVNALVARVPTVWVRLDDPRGGLEDGERRPRTSKAGGSAMRSGRSR
jgi:hypothetical protein